MTDFETHPRWWLTQICLFLQIWYKLTWHIPASEREREREMAGMWLRCISCPSSTADVRHMSVTFLPALSPAAGQSSHNTTSTWCPQTKNKPLILKNIVNINKSRIWTRKRPCVSLNNSLIYRERSVIAIPQHCIFKHTIVSIVPPENKPREEDPWWQFNKAHRLPDPSN